MNATNRVVRETDLREVERQLRVLKWISTVQGVLIILLLFREWAGCNI